LVSLRPQSTPDQNIDVNPCRPPTAKLITNLFGHRSYYYWFSVVLKTNKTFWCSALKS